MAITKKSVVDQIEIARTGELNIRMALLLVDGEQELARKLHRTQIPPNVDPAIVMGFVNTHLADMGEQPISAQDIADVVHYHAVSSEKLEQRNKG